MRRRIHMDTSSIQVHTCMHTFMHAWFFDRETCWNRLRRDPSNMSAWRRGKESLVEVVSWDLKAVQEALDVPVVTVKLHKGSTILWRFDGGSLPLKRPTCDLFAVCKCCFQWGQYGVLVWTMVQGGAPAVISWKLTYLWKITIFNG